MFPERGRFYTAEYNIDLYFTTYNITKDNFSYYTHFDFSRTVALVN